MKGNEHQLLYRQEKYIMLGSTNQIKEVHMSLYLLKSMY